MKIYISGPISGKDPKETRKRFLDVATKLRKSGDVVIDPTDIAHWGQSWRNYMLIAFQIITGGDVDVMYMLSGWQESNGACLERYYAILSGIPVTYQSADDRVKYQIKKVND